MKTLLKHTAEAAVFGGLAIALLLSGFISWPERGMQSQGAGGASRVSVAAASQAVAEMVQRWEQPVEVQTNNTPPLTAPELPSQTVSQRLPPLNLPVAPAAQLQVALPTKLTVEDIETSATQPAQIDTTRPPAPPPEQLAAAQPSKRPVARPQRTEPKTAAQRPKEKKAPKPQQRLSQKTQAASVKSDGGAAQKAAGVGGGASAGQAAGAVTTKSASQAQNAKLEDIWGARIKTKIRRAQKYPRRGKGVATVVVKVVINADGRLQSHRIVRSSGQDVFDKAALRAIKSIRRYPKAPRGYSGGQTSFNAALLFQR